MTALKIALFSALTLSSAPAQADFRFYVFDETKNEKLHYEFAQDITVYDFESQLPRFVYSTGYRVYGINQDQFTFTTEQYAGDLSRADYAALIKRARELPIEGLDTKKKDEGATGSFGWINLDGKDHTVTATPDLKVRKQWQSFLDKLISDHAPVEKREVTKRTLEGETVAPRVLDFATLLKSPKDYDGKRVRLTGFYHGEFEGSSFAATKAGIRDYDNALWLGGTSGFADPKKISGINDATLTVDGTFELGPGGHMGLWMGELVRITASKPTKAEGRTGQPATRSESKSEGSDKPQTEAERRSR